MMLDCFAALAMTLWGRRALTERFTMFEGHLVPVIARRRSRRSNPGALRTPLDCSAGLSQ